MARVVVTEQNPLQGQKEKFFGLESLPHCPFVYISMDEAEDLYYQLKVVLGNGPFPWEHKSNDVHGEGFDQRFADERLGYAMRVAMKSVLREEKKSRFHPE